jgi:pyrimidine-specific ribonucleoside hydrolase
VARSESSITDYTGLIGDAGAICALVDPDALRTRLLPVRVELTGYGRGQTIVDQRRRVGEDIVHGTAGTWEVAEVALDVDAPRFVKLFLDTLGLSSPRTET